MPVAVMHVTDSLDTGGMERVAVDLVNCLPRERFVSYLCTTRREGPLADLVTRDVGRLRLQRTGRFDAGALRHLLAFVREHHIRILHAHGSSLFFSAAARLIERSVKVVWHCHYGRFDLEMPSTWLYRPAAKCVSGVITVNEPMAEWSRTTLRVPGERVWYIPNFVHSPEPLHLPFGLPGQSGSRIICVANFRPQKDHLCLLRAMSLVVRKEPAAHLLLVGAPADEAYRRTVLREIEQLGLSGVVSVLGQRDDVVGLLRSCDVAVLSSASEGLPLALIEYGMAGLATVATRCGQCAGVLDEGKAGRLVPPGDACSLADALLSFLRSAEERRQFGARFRRHVERNHSPAAVVDRVCSVYDTLLLRN